jgi:Ni/Co efflux regulator RcnB
MKKIVTAAVLALSAGAAMAMPLAAHAYGRPTVVVDRSWHGDRYWDGHRYWQRHEWERRRHEMRRHREPPHRD